MALARDKGIGTRKQPSKFLRASVFSVVFCSFFCSSVRADALVKLKPEKLEAVHQAIQALRREWRPIARGGPYREYRANLHLHSSLSHDSRGTIEEIVSAAKTVGTSILMFTEHPSDKSDYFKAGHRGIKDGVLLIPGAETGGFLVFPTAGRAEAPEDSGANATRHARLAIPGPVYVDGPPQEFADLVRGRGGLIFLSHLEERMDWEIRNLTGTEIYNTHADFKDERTLQKAMRNPLWIIQMAEMFRKYPQEAFSSLQDYPTDYLKKWDELCRKAPHTGIAANDAHQNVGLVVRLAEGNKARFEDALGKSLFELDGAAIPLIQPLLKDKEKGEVVFQIRLDPYENSLRHVGTHLLLTEQSEKAVWEALKAGRAFVAFDWLGDSKGFDFIAISEKHRYEMGSRPILTKGMKLQGQAPLPGKWRLFRDGNIVLESSGRGLEVAVAEPGNYRVEVWLKIAGEDMIWILSNPIYIRRT
jgi:hypothetical protein